MQHVRPDDDLRMYILDMDSDRLFIMDAIYCFGLD